ncbi:MAG: hypothetical protein Q9163_001709 [Psora crenata]
MHISIQASVLVALVLGDALAQPAHRHTHQHKRSLVEVLNKRWGTPPNGWDDPANYEGVDFSKIDYSGNGGQPHASSVTAPQVENKLAVEPTSEPSGEPSGEPSSQPSATPSPGDGKKKSHDGGSGSCSDLADVYETGDNSAGAGPTAATSGNHKRATFEQDTYVGNTGESTYASNLKPESNCKSSSKYSLKFTNNMGSEQDFWLWNKIGASGVMDGISKNAFFQFRLADAQSAVFSVEPNSQIGFSQACGRAPTNGGVPNCNIGEANFNDGSKDTTGGSFYDVSMVTYNEITTTGGKPKLVPMTISADGYDDSTTSNCVYTLSSHNSAINPWSNDSCALGPNDPSPFHVNVVYG